MDKHENKILYFLSALQDVYREPEERESECIPKLELSNNEVTDDFFAIIQAFLSFIRELQEMNQLIYSDFLI